MASLPYGRYAKIGLMADNFPKDTSHFKLIVSDFDGTLAGADHSVSSEVKQAINKWQEKNRFTIASGRQFLMIGRDSRALEINTPLIVRGGAEIVDQQTGSVIYSQEINKQMVKEFVDIINLNGHGIMVEVKDTLYGNINYDTSEYPEVQLKSLDKLPFVDSPKINVRVQKNKVKEIEEFMEKIVMPKFPQLHMVRSYNVLGMSWDVTSIKGTKNLAVLKLIKMLGINREDTVGVGDGYNDFPLLEACGFKVAMGNANEELKAIADVIVPSYEENGVAFLIDRLLK